MVDAAVVSGIDVLDVVLELVVLLVGVVLEVDESVVVSVELDELEVLTTVVVDGSLVVVAGSLVVVGSIVVGGLEVDERSSVTRLVVDSDEVAGAMLPRPSLVSSTMPGRPIDVGASGVVSGTTVPPIGAAGTRSESASTAFRAKGAATAAAVTVESDRASQNRPRPAGSPGRCRCMNESELEGLTVADSALLTFVLAEIHADR